MSAHRLQSVLSHVYRSAAGPAPDADARLLERYTRHGDAAAFAALVRRHGPLVLGVCRRALHQPADVEDAFQATFLVLARRAATIRRPAALPGWLHGVAWRVARKLRTPATVAAEAPDAVADDTANPARAAAWRELCGLLDKELHRLPPRLREPLLLCYLEGLTRDEAAARLGLSASTVKRRLERGRAVLRARLTRRGVTLAAALAGADCAGPAARSAVPARLLELAAQPAATSARAARLAAAAFPSVTGKLVCGAVLLVGLGLTLAAGTAPTDPPQTPTAPPAVPTPPGAQARDPLPPGAVARFGSLRLRYDPAARPGVVFAPDGRSLVTGSPIDGLRVWDTANGRLLYHDPTPVVSGRLALSPDGRWAAAEGRDGFRLWDLRTRQRLDRPIDDGGQVTLWDLAFDPAGGRLAAGTLDAGSNRHAVRVWELPSGAERLRLTDFTASVRQIAFADGGRTIVAVDSRLNVSRHDAGSGRPLGRVNIPGEDATVDGSYRLAPDGRSLVWAPRGQAPGVWDTATGERRHTFQDVPGGVVGGLDITPDGRQVALTVIPADGPRLGVWDAATGRRLRLQELPRVEFDLPDFRIAPDGRTAALFGRHRGVVRLWDLDAGRPRPTSDGHEFAVTSVATAPDGHTAISSDGHSLRGWDLASGAERWAVDAPGVSGVAAANGGSFLTSRQDGRVEQRELATGRVERELVTARPAPGASVWIVRDAARRTLVVRRPRRPPEVIESIIPGPEGEWSRVGLPVLWDETVSPDGRWVAGMSLRRFGQVSDRFIVYDRATGQEVAAWETQSPGPFTLAPDGRTVARLVAEVVPQESGPPVSRRWLRFEEVPSGRLIRAAPVAADWATRLAFAPDGRTLAVTYQDRSWELREAADGRVLFHRRYDTEATALAFAPDGRRLLTGHADGTVLVWDLTPAK